MKTLLSITFLALLFISCSSQKKNKEDWLESSKKCNQICIDNEKVQEVTFKAGGGLPLLFLGSFEAKCVCDRSK